jgi:hypothetical protein
MYFFAIIVVTTAYFAVYTISTRRFCDQQDSLESVQTGRSSP